MKLLAITAVVADACGERLLVCVIGSFSQTNVRSIAIKVGEAVAAQLFHVSTMPKPPGNNASLREHFAWTYGTLAMVHAAVKDGKTRYKPLHFIIRGRFRHGFLSGKMRMRPLHDDEKTKIAHATTCCYCGREAKLSLDHLIPKLKGGPDAADNITYACRSCNSSKGPKDMVLWLVSKGRFPAILVFRRYLKLAARWCEDAKLMEASWADLPDGSLPFDKRSLRVKWPELSVHRLWPDPPEQ